MPRRYYLILLLATLAGAWLRLWQLTNVPPGLHYDLAATALLGNQVAFDGARPIFIQAFTGHEVLFYYWLAAWFNFTGSSIFTLRLAAAMLGTLTIPATFFAVRQLMRLLAPNDKAFQFTIASLAAVLLTFTFFHVTFSRFGFRVITQPLLQCLALGFLLKAILQFSNTPKENGGIRELLLAGFFTGLAAYTYLSARLFPFPLAVFWLVIFFSAWRLRNTQHALRAYISRFTLYVSSAALTFAPLGLYFLQHPEDFLNRFTQVAPRAGDETLVWQGIQRALEMVFINGEPYDRYNLPGLPLLVMPLGIFFVVGLWLIGYSLTRPPVHPFARAAQILLLVWLPFMLLPTALAVREIFPSTIRAFGVTPLLFVFPAWGILAAFRWLQKQWPGPLLPSAYPVTLLILAILGFGTAQTYSLYFERWANLPSQRLNNETDMTGAAQYLNASTLENYTPAVTSIHYRHPTLAYLARDFNAVQWLTGGTSLVLPASGGLLVVDAASAPLPKDWTVGWEPYRVHQQAGNLGPELSVYEFPAGQTPPLPGFKPLNENFSNIIFTTGFRTSVVEGKLRVDVRWRVENPAPAEDFLPYVRVYDAAGRQWAQSANYTFPSLQWRAGDILVTRHTLELPPGLPPESYVLKVGLYSESTQTSLNRLTQEGGFGGQRAVLGSVQLQNTNVTVDEIRRAFAFTPVSGGPPVLLGYQLPSAAARQNQRFELTLFWYSDLPLSGPLKISLGDEVLLDTPVSIERALVQKLTLRVPPEMPAGKYTLQVSVGGAAAFSLAELEVLAVPRTFNVPATATRTAVDLENKVRVAGYELTPGATTRLKIYWQALSALETDYTVFVHVLDAAGQIVRQADAQPQAGAYATSGWLAGEVVSDEYNFTLPPGNYWLALGLYEAETGQRLTTLNGDRVEIGPIQVP